MSPNTELEVQIVNLGDAGRAALRVDYIVSFRLDALAEFLMMKPRNILDRAKVKPVRVDVSG